MTAPSPTRRILVVDDDPTCRALLEAIFESHGFAVTATDSVIGASALLAQSRPHVILLDLALPYRSGASWLAQLKADPETAGIPVVILSAAPDVLPRERRGLAQAIIRKPFRTATLLDTVQSLCIDRAPTGPTLLNDSVSIQPLGLL